MKIINLWVIVLAVLLSFPLVLGDISRGPGGGVLREAGRAGLESTKTIIPVMIMFGLLTMFLVNKYRKNKEKFQPLILGLVTTWAILILIFVQTNELEPEPLITDDWQKEMTSLIKESDSIYLTNEEYYDYNNPLITEVSKRLIKESNSPEEYTQKVLDYVYDNIKYDWGEDDDACIKGSAPLIINKGEGQCDTQSMVVVSMLRKAGVPSRIIGGCIVRKTDCGKLMGLIEVRRRPLYTPLIEVSVDDIYSRGVDSRKGGLHAFPQVKLPIAGNLVWHTLEATTGEFADTNCYYYYPEIEDVSTKKEICVSQDYDYAIACSNNNNDLLRTYGGAYLI